MIMKLTINKLIANDMINYGMDKTSSFNYIVSLNSYLEEYDEESQKYIKENLDDIKDDIERNECVADLVVEKNDDDTVPNIFEKVAKELGIEPEISSFHAGAETHIYANRTNAKGEKFSPYLLGLATVCNMHSAREYVDYKTMIKGQELLKAFFEAFNK